MPNELGRKERCGTAWSELARQGEIWLGLGVPVAGEQNYQRPVAVISAGLPLHVEAEPWISGLDGITPVPVPLYTGNRSVIKEVSRADMPTGALIRLYRIDRKKSTVNVATLADITVWYLEMIASGTNTPSLRRLCSA